MDCRTDKLGRTLPQVSAYLDHRDVMVTMTVYAHFLREKRDEMNDLEALTANGRKSYGTTRIEGYSN